MERCAKPPREAPAPASWRKQGYARRRGAYAMAGGLGARSRVWATTGTTPGGQTLSVELHANHIRSNRWLLRRSGTRRRPHNRHRSARTPGATPAARGYSDIQARAIFCVSSLECHVVRDTSLLAPGFVHSLIFRQIKPIGNRQARRMIGDQKRHRDLTIVGLAEPPAIFSGSAACR